MISVSAKRGRTCIAGRVTKVVGKIMPKSQMHVNHVRSGFSAQSSAASDCFVLLYYTSLSL